MTVLSGFEIEGLVDVFVQAEDSMETGEGERRHIAMANAIERTWIWLKWTLHAYISPRLGKGLQTKRPADQSDPTPTTKVGFLGWVIPHPPPPLK